MKDNYYSIIKNDNNIQLTLYLPKTYIIPEWIINSTSQEELIIGLDISTLKKQLKIICSDETKTSITDILYLQYEKEKEKLSKEHLKYINEIKNKNDTQISTIECNNEKELNKLKIQIDKFQLSEINIKEEYSNQYSKDMNKLKEELIEKEFEYQKNINEFKNKNDTQISTIEFNNQKELNNLKIQLEKLQVSELLIKEEYSKQYDIRIKDKDMENKIFREELSKEFENIKKDKDFDNRTNIDNLRQLYDKIINEKSLAISDKDNQIIKLQQSEITIKEQFSKDLEIKHKEIHNQYKNADNLYKDLYEKTTYTLSEKDTEINKLRERIELKQLIQNNSSKKGIAGELEFQEAVSHKWNLIKTAHIPHSGDFITNVHNINICFEVKKYTNPVPTKEIDKLKRDLFENTSFDCGIFISMNSPITNHSSIDIEWTSTNQPILYIPLFCNYDINHITDYMEIFFQTIKPYRNIINNPIDTDIITKERKQRAIHQLQILINTLSKYITSLNNNKTIIIKALDTLYQDTKTSYNNIIDNVKSISAILCGDENIIKNNEEVNKNTLIPNAPQSIVNIAIPKTTFKVSPISDYFINNKVVKVVDNPLSKWLYDTYDTKANKNEKIKPADMLIDFQVVTDNKNIKIKAFNEYMTNLGFSTSKLNGIYYYKSMKRNIIS